ncbi:MAG: acyl carrier protein phosphodiesterase [Gammaproteobacteria bacterium]|jgi:acyl carrier protein phosphodiesterase
MNYLAHLLLSQSDAESMVGNLMGDFRKYLGDAALPDNVNLGIQNHLRVDKFTDSNQIVLDLKPMFSRERRRFAGIIIDVTFDYFLIRHWQTYSEIDFNEFINQAHLNIASLSNIMPRRMQFVMDYMIKEEWLRSYGTLQGIAHALDRMSTRIRFENKMVGAIEEVEGNYEQLEEGFLKFFPTLINHIETN